MYARVAYEGETCILMYVWYTVNVCLTSSSRMSAYRLVVVLELIAARMASRCDVVQPMHTRTYMHTTTGTKNMNAGTYAGAQQGKEWQLDLVL